MKKWSVLALTALGIASVGHASEQEGWQFELTPYIWGVAVDGDLTARGQTAEIDQSFSDISDNIDAAFMGLGVASYNRLVLYVNYDYLSISDDATIKQGSVFPAGSKITGEIDASIATGAIGYRFDTFGEHSFIDVMVGARTLSLDTTLKGLGQKVDRDNDITDTILMLRPSFQISERWRFNPTLSYAVDGDSETAYELMPQFQYSFSDSFALRFGYKAVHYETESGTEGTTSYREWDGDFNGPFVGIGWTFPSREKPVAAPPPEPVVAAAPAKCADGDGDGVCDSADQCPNTPPGKRVDPAGCDCDFVLRTHFAFDSAELTAEDKADLDKLAAVLANPNLQSVVGEIQGHTDSVGKPEYNQKLSQRRADAVAEYLQAKGVSLGGRFQAVGMGETTPIADNASEAGRAENRRVVIRRMDCSAN